MIRLRKLIDRGRRHPVLGPVLIVVLVLVIALMMFHEGHESTGADVGVLCVGIMLLLIRAVVPRPTTPESVSAQKATVARAPPRTTTSHIVPAGYGGPRSLPLRL